MRHFSSELPKLTYGKLNKKKTSSTVYKNKNTLQYSCCGTQVLRGYMSSMVCGEGSDTAGLTPRASHKVASSFKNRGNQTSQKSCKGIPLHFWRTIQDLFSHLTMILHSFAHWIWQIQTNSAWLFLTIM